jgi:hypothetical protein
MERQRGSMPGWERLQAKVLRQWPTIYAPDARLWGTIEKVQDIGSQAIESVAPQEEVRSNEDRRRMPLRLHHLRGRG